MKNKTTSVNKQTEPAIICYGLTARQQRDASLAVDYYCGRINEQTYRHLISKEVSVAAERERIAALVAAMSVNGARVGDGGNGGG